LIIESRRNYKDIHVMTRTKRKLKKQLDNIAGQVCWGLCGMMLPEGVAE
jgi:hypothetical protein